MESLHSKGAKNAFSKLSQNLDELTMCGVFFGFIERHSNGT